MPFKLGNGELEGTRAPRTAAILASDEEDEEERSPLAPVVAAKLANGFVETEGNDRPTLELELLPLPLAVGPGPKGLPGDVARAAPGAIEARGGAVETIATGDARPEDGSGAAEDEGDGWAGDATTATTAAAAAGVRSFEPRSFFPPRMRPNRPFFLTLLEGLSPGDEAATAAASSADGHASPEGERTGTAMGLAKGFPGDEAETVRGGTGVPAPNGFPGDPAGAGEAVAVAAAKGPLLRIGDADKDDDAGDSPNSDAAAADGEDKAPVLADCAVPRASCNW